MHVSVEIMNFMLDAFVSDSAILWVAIIIYPFFALLVSKCVFDAVLSKTTKAAIYNIDGLT